MSQIKKAIKTLAHRTNPIGDRFLESLDADAIMIEFEDGKMLSLLEYITSVEKRLRQCGCRLYINDGKFEVRND